MKIARNPARVHAPVAGYTHQIELSGPQQWLVLSGQLGRRVDGSVPDDPVEQLAVALDNIGHNLDAAGMAIADLVKLTLYLVGDIDTARRREVLTAWLRGHEPCMTLIYVAGLATPQYRVELDAWAAVSPDPAGSTARDGTTRS